MASKGRNGRKPTVLCPIFIDAGSPDIPIERTGRINRNVVETYHLHLYFAL